MPRPGREPDRAHCERMPTVHGFRAWKLALRDEVASVSMAGERGFQWVLSVEKPGATLALLSDSGEFPTVDSKLAAALSKAIHGEFARRINIMKEEHASRGKLFKGRQILFLIYQHYRTTEAEGQMLDLQDLMAVRLQGDDARKFLNDWETTLQGMRIPPSEDVLETFFNK